MGRIILYTGLYVVLISMASNYLIDFGKGIVNSTSISALTKKVNRIENRQFSAKDFKLISSTPQSNAVMEKFAPSIASLQYNDVILAKILEDKKKQELALAKKLSRSQPKKSQKVARQVQTLKLNVDSVMDTGAIINGRYYKNGDQLLGSGKVVLNGFNRMRSMIRLSIDNRNYQFRIDDGLVNENIMMDESYTPRQNLANQMMFNN